MYTNLRFLFHSPMPELPPVMSTTLSERSRPCRMSSAAVFPSYRFGFTTTSSTVKACLGSKYVLRLLMWLKMTEQIYLQAIIISQVWMLSITFYNIILTQHKLSGRPHQFPAPSHMVDLKTAIDFLFFFKNNNPNHQRFHFFLTKAIISKYEISTQMKKAETSK